MSIKRTLIFQHVFRSGGTTLITVLQRYYKKEFNINRKISENTLESFLKLSQEETDDIELLRGHMPFGLHFRFSHPCDYITILRDPVKRAISVYSLLTTATKLKDREVYRQVKDLTLKEFIEQDFDGVNNHQTRLFSNPWSGTWDPSCLVNRDSLERAKENLRTHFKVVGVTNRSDETMVLLAKTFGWRYPYYSGRQNTTTKSPVSEDILRFIEEKNQLDMELYSFAQGLFEEQIQNYGSAFEKDLRKFRRENKMFGLLYGIASVVPVELRFKIKKILLG
jgi:hypothetical protein